MINITSSLSLLSRATERKELVREQVAKAHKSLDEAETVVAFETELLFAQVLPLMAVGEILYDPYSHGGDKPMFGVMKTGDGTGRLVPLVAVYTVESRAELQDESSSELVAVDQLQAVEPL